MLETIKIYPVFHLKRWFEAPIYHKGQSAYIEGIGVCIFKENCWTYQDEKGVFQDFAYALVEVLCANNEIEELEECAG